MPHLNFSGPFGPRLRSFLTLNAIALQVGLRHLAGRRIAPDWDWSTEVGIRFWRHHFKVAMGMTDIRKGRALFDSLLTETDDVYDVTVEVSDTPRGLWITPRKLRTPVTALYFHGGGYSFNGPVSERFAAMLAHHTGARLFMPQYRLTPEHPHPAQAEDALAAWRYVSAERPGQNIAVIGDSAGGHMALILLQTLKNAGGEQPGICIAICPWTDIGARGDSMTQNDRYDLVQGWMAVTFGTWLDPEGRFGRAALSPISHDFSRLAPLYLLAGGREVLRDMILDFAQVQAWNGADVLLDLWPDMPHNFPAYDSSKPASTQALARLRAAVLSCAPGGEPFGPAPDVTQIAAGRFAPGAR